MLVLALTLVLRTADYGPSTGAEGAISSIFQSNEEATDFSTHVGWGLTLPLTGYMLGGKRGALTLGGIWIWYSLINEAVHPVETDRERTLNLVSRIAPCAAVMLWIYVFK